jgi:monovalent cation:proton antiporter-2 (CPA2) family protein
VTPDTFLAQALVYLGAAVLLVPLATRLGLGSVLGYLISGVLIGPWGLGLVAEESKTVMHFAEFGVVMMLFLVGLELDPARLWRLRGPVLGLGGAQVGGTAVLVLALALLLGLPWPQGLALGLVVAMSSTAIALQTLGEKGLLRSEAGQASFSVLLFQDLAVIPILALFPLLATLEVHAADHGHASPAAWMSGFPAWQRGAITLGAVVGVVVLGRLGAGPLLHRVAQSRLREMFTAASLLLVVGVAALMSWVGLSAALGAFVAGVVLANSEYRHELMADVEPFKGLLLGTFFMAVGASIDFAVLAEAPASIAGLVLGVVLLKLLVLLGVARLGRLSWSQALIFAAVLCQVGEFAFVLLGYAEQSGVLPHDLTGPLTAVTAFSMAATPLVLRAVERWLLPRLGAVAPPREHDVVDEHPAVIIAGYGRFGQIAGRLLRATGRSVTVLDIDSEQVEMLKKFGQKVFYGDASRVDLLHAAGAQEARVLVVAVDEPEKVAEIVETARKHFPHLHILARARGRTEAYGLLDQEVAGVYRETFDAALRAGADALRLLGVPAHAAHRVARTFREHDERSLRELAAVRHDEQGLVTRARERLRDFERLMAAEGHHQDGEVLTDRGWDSEPLREAAQRGAAAPAELARP